MGLQGTNLLREAPDNHSDIWIGFPSKEDASMDDEALNEC